MRQILRRKNLRSILLWAVSLTCLSVTIVAMAASFYFASAQFKAEQSQQRKLIQNTLSELISPSLAISDYNAVQRFLGSINKLSDVTGVITRYGDILLSDYKYYDAFAVLKTAKTPLNCNELPARFEPKGTSSFAVTCTQISEALIITLSPEAQFRLPTVFTPLLVVSALTLLISVIFLIWILSAHVITPIQNLSSQIIESSNTPLNPRGTLTNIQDMPQELSDLHRAYLYVLSKFQLAHEKSSRAEQKEALFSQARQIAHDIRSPLSALAAVSSSLDPSSAETALLRGALKRINDIANNLLEASRNSELREPTSLLAPKLPIEITSLIKQVLAEKEAILSKQGAKAIQIVTKFESDSILALVEGVGFQRVISNLLNNSIEAISHIGKIECKVSRSQGMLEISIRDDGCGIPAHVLPNLLNSSQSYQKSEGYGLGLSHATRSISSWNGSLEVRSMGLGLGSEVIIRLPEGINNPINTTLGPDQNVAQLLLKGSDN